MKRIPPDIDQVMWALAEDPQGPSLDEFARRYPEYRAELGKRIAMVRGLKGSGPKLAGASPIPRFTPPPPPQPAWRKPVMLFGSAIVLAGLAFASYWATTAAVRDRKPEAPVAVQAPPIPPRDELRLPEPTVVYTPPTADDVPSLTKGKSETDDLPSITFRIDDAPLLDALRSLAFQANLELEIGPGMENVNPLIRADYWDSNPFGIFADLGKRFGFTPFYQGERKILLIPAVDPSKPEASAPIHGQATSVESLQDDPSLRTPREFRNN